jgi:hypothetical protein
VAATLRTQTLSPALTLGTAAVLATAIIFAGERPSAPPGNAPAAKPPTSCVRRATTREVIAQEVVAGRLPLPQAVAMYARLNDLPPRTALPTEPMVDEATQYGVAVGTESSAEEAVWVQTMLWVLRQADRDRAGKFPAELTRSLASEYRAARAAGRLARLPAVDESAYQRLAGESERIAQRLTGPGLPPGDIE